MDTYLIGAQMGTDNILLGNSLYGVCSTFATTTNKIVILNAFDGLEHGVNINVRFTYGSNVPSNATLKVGSATAIPVYGALKCSANEIVSFVYEEQDASNKYWRIVGSIVAPASTAPQDISTSAAVGVSAAYAREDHVHRIQAEVGQNKGEIVIAGQTLAVPGASDTTYGLCDSRENNSNKTLTLDHFSLIAGTTIQVKFANANSREATLDVNSTGPYPIVQYGPNGAIKTQWNAGAVLTLTFDGSGWVRDEITLDSEAAVQSVNFNTSTHVLSYTTNDNNTETVATFGSMVMENAIDYIPKSIFNDAYQMLYYDASGNIATVAANNTTARMFLLMQGVQITNPSTGVITYAGAAPIWSSLTTADVGLDNLVNTLQVTNVTYNENTGNVQVTIGDDEPTTLFTLGSNAFTSIAYLPLEGGTMTGSITLSGNGLITNWSTTDAHRLVVIDNAVAESFKLQVEHNSTWTDIITIDDVGTVTATEFVGSLTGNADSASALLFVTLTPVNLDATTGVFAFQSTIDNILYKGLQIGELQIARANGETLARSYDTNTWSNWYRLLTERDITTGDNNGQIKVGNTNVDVQGLGALAYLDEIDTSNIELSNYVTINTTQTITGTKLFSRAEFDDTHIAAFVGANGEVDLYNDDDMLQIIGDSNDIAIGWLDNNIPTVVHTFSDTGYTTTGIIKPETNLQGTVGTSMYQWAAMYANIFYGNLSGNANTATRALNDTNGLQIDTSYLKLSGGTMSGIITTQYPINQALVNGTAINGVNGTTVSFPARWSFNSHITPQDGDIITIQTPGPGHDNGIFLSLDNGTNYYPITLTNGNRMIDEYPEGSYITIIYDSANTATSLYPVAGGNTRTSATGTWRVINYYDSGAPYGIRIYKRDHTLLNSFYPLLVSDSLYGSIGDENVDSYTNNIYGLVGTDVTKVPAFNPSTGAVRATSFVGNLTGVADTALAFDTGATVTLTGHVTGVSDASTKNWTIATTIANDVIINPMLRGGITKDKLEADIVKVFRKSEFPLTGVTVNYDDISINGLTYMQASSAQTESGRRPMNSAGVLFALQNPDKTSVLQLAGNNIDWKIRGSASDTLDVAALPWHTLVTEYLAEDGFRKTWDLSISGAAGSATTDASGHTFTDYYATKTELNQLLGLNDALVFKGFLVDVLHYSEQYKRYSSLPSRGYHAGWTYKVGVPGPLTFAGQLCEEGDLVIAISDEDPANTGGPIDSHWVVVQGNLESAVSGPGQLVPGYSLAIFSPVVTQNGEASGKFINSTGAYILSLNHTPLGNNHDGYLDGLKISGATYSAVGTILGNTANELIFGDSGPQLQFEDVIGDGNATTARGAIIFNGHATNSGLASATSFDFVAQSRPTVVKTDGLIARTGAVIGTNFFTTNDALYVSGNSVFNGNFTVIGQIGNTSDTYQFTIACENNRFKFKTQSSVQASNIGWFEFTQGMYVNGSIIPIDAGSSSGRTLGVIDTNGNLISWQKVYIGQNHSYGSDEQPIYWSDGAPTAITYTANKLYAPVPREGETGVPFRATNHYITNASLAINSDHSWDEALYVGGDARIVGDLYTGGNLSPASGVTNKTLGTSNDKWSAIYVGNANSYGSEYIPIYWNNGVPTVTKIVQKKNFTIDSGYASVTLNNINVYGADTIVLQIVVTSGKENLTGPITWTAYEGAIVLETTTTRGDVLGYILTARGVDLDKEAEQEAEQNDGE